MHTKHSQLRSQQRGIPPLISTLLDQYGHREHDGHGGVICIFTRQSINQMERDMGHAPVRKLIPEWRRAYKVVSTADGSTITVGIRTQRIRRT